MNMTSIKDLNGSPLEFQNVPGIGRFTVAGYAFHNHQGPAVALAVLDTCTWGSSIPATELRSMIAAIDFEPAEPADEDDVVDATVLDDPADAVRTALDALTKAGVRQREHDQSRYGSPASLEHAACILTEWIHADEQASDQRALEGEALTLCRTMWDNPDQQWGPMSSKAKSTWLTMARTARTIYGVTA